MAVKAKTLTKTANRAIMTIEKGYRRRLAQNID